MLQSQRQEKIVEFLSENSFLSVCKAVEMYGASPATISRDFKELARKNLLKRVHGGVQPIKPSHGMLPFAFRELSYSEEKRALAAKAVSMIEPNQVIFIDGGTTTFHMGMCLCDIPLHIITNSVRLASLLEEQTADKAGIEITLTGGYLYKQSGILLGPNTNFSIKQYHADWAFLSAGGVDVNGIFNTNELVAETERTMIDNSDKRVVLADHSKIGNKALCKVCHPDDIDILITNNLPERREFIEKLGELVEIVNV